MKKITLSQFTFTLKNYGCYEVRYTKSNGEYYTAHIYDMPLIDATKNSEEPKAKDLKELAWAIQRNGKHYNKYDEEIINPYSF